MRRVCRLIIEATVLQEAATLVDRGLPQVATVIYLDQGALLFDDGVLVRNFSDDKSGENSVKGGLLSEKLGQGRGVNRNCKLAGVKG
ncbi:hypothetical protein D5086_026681 [Populus alba]|uniref:Uncharacterized protein n=1 Tax=Populus alba TaxID=43335 RepID=A0ACC4B2Z0_POPAL